MGRKRSKETEGIDRKGLLWVMGEMCRVAKKNIPLVILQHALVEWDSRALEITATDLDLRLHFETPWTLPGSTAVQSAGRRDQTEGDPAGRW